MAITEFFHLIHVVDDEDEVDAWYDAGVRAEGVHHEELDGPREAMGVPLVDR